MGFSNSTQRSENSSQQTSQSANQAYPSLQSALGNQVNNTEKGSTALANLLGLNGTDAGADAFKQFKDSSSYNFIQNEGLRGINANNASRGLLRSGSALKAISGYTTNLATNFLNSYLSNLTGLSNTGIQAGQILASAGSTANSQGTSYGTSTGKSTNFSLG